MVIDHVDYDALVGFLRQVFECQPVRLVDDRSAEMLHDVDGSVNTVAAPVVECMAEVHAGRPWVIGVVVGDLRLVPLEKLWQFTTEVTCGEDLVEELKGCWSAVHVVASEAVDVLDEHHLCQRTDFEQLDSCEEVFHELDVTDALLSCPALAGNESCEGDGLLEVGRIFVVAVADVVRVEGVSFRIRMACDFEGVRLSWLQSVGSEHLGVDGT